MTEAARNSETLVNFWLHCTITQKTAILRPFSLPAVNSFQYIKYITKQLNIGIRKIKIILETILQSLHWLNDNVCYSLREAAIDAVRKSHVLEMIQMHHFVDILTRSLISLLQHPLCLQFWKGSEHFHMHSSLDH